MFNNPYMINAYNPQNSIDRINNQINELESMKKQLQQPIQQPTNLTQNFQISPTNHEVIRYANALNRYEDDCVIRAISCATNKSWDYVYDYLSDIAQYEGTLLDKREFVRNYLDRTYKRLDDIYGTVGQVSAMFPNNTLLITMHGHIVCSKNGIIYDTFDCRDREVENVWLID